MRINFDRPTNSLIIVSSLKDYQAVRRVIERLDSPRKQVFVEAMILEVTLDKSRELGASFHAAKPFSIPGHGRPEPGRRRPEPGQDVVPGGRADRDDAGWRARPGAGSRRGQEPRRRVDGDARHPFVRRAHQGVADQQRRRRVVEPAPADHEQRGRRDLGRLARAVPGQHVRSGRRAARPAGPRPSRASAG